MREILRDTLAIALILIGTALALCGVAMLEPPFAWLQQLGL